MDINNINPVQLLETLYEGVVVHDSTTKIVYANPKALELLHLTKKEILNKDATDLDWCFIDTHHKLIPQKEYPVNRVLSDKCTLSNIEIGICDRTTDRITWVLCNAYPQFDSSGEVSEVVVGLLNISAMKTSIPFDAIVAHANDVILITEANAEDGDPQIVYGNQAFYELTGYAPDEVIGKSPKILQGEGTSAETRQRIRDAVENNEPIREKILNYSKAGVPYWLDMNIFPLENSHGEVQYFAAVERDITNQVEEKEKLQDLASKDPLTDLLNRRGFFELARKQLTSKSSKNESTVAVIDIDYFKKINDSFGHDCGDRVLVRLAAQLRAAFRDTDLICRYGGEEFIVLLAGAGISNSKKKLDMFRENIASLPFETCEGESINITISIGLTAIPANARYIETALNSADKALYDAKQSGRNKIVIYE